MKEGDIVQVADNKDTKKIHDWGIINISCNKECEHINTKNNKCDKKASFINDGVLLCSQHSKNKKYTCVKKYKNNQNTIFNIGILLLKKIKEKEFNKFNIEDVLLENQPCLKNPTMKSVQMMMYTFFILRGVMNDNSSITKVHMVNARNKLKIYKGKSHPHEVQNPKIIDFGKINFKNKISKN